MTSRRPLRVADGRLDEARRPVHPAGLPYRSGDTTRRLLKTSISQHLTDYRPQPMAIEAGKRFRASGPRAFDAPGDGWLLVRDRDRHDWYTVGQ